MAWKEDCGGVGLGHDRPLKRKKPTTTTLSVVDIQTDQVIELNIRDPKVKREIKESLQKQPGEFD